MNQADFFQECVGAYPEVMLWVAIFRNWHVLPRDRAILRKTSRRRAAFLQTEF